jgi:hypothetical protein
MIFNQKLINKYRITSQILIKYYNNQLYCMKFRFVFWDVLRYP